MRGVANGITLSHPGELRGEIRSRRHDVSWEIGQPYRAQRTRSV